MRGTDGAHHWVCLGGLWRHNLRYYICFLTSSVLTPFPVLLPGLHLCSVCPFHQDVPALEPGNHGLNPLETVSQLNLCPLSCRHQVLYSTDGKLMTTAIHHPKETHPLGLYLPSMCP